MVKSTNVNPKRCIYYTLEKVYELLYNKSEVICMPMVYDKLWKRLEDAGISTYKIRKEKLIPESTLQRLRSGGDVSTKSIGELCLLLDCQPGDLMEYVKPEK